ncbi:ornithine decarboxylase antizyme [Paramyrothecium foliicola]|nr:ornithine decarboxylase antizyme [Paramyrothecium foliicola]
MPRYFHFMTAFVPTVFEKERKLCTVGTPCSHPTCCGTPLGWRCQAENNSNSAGGEDYRHGCSTSSIKTEPPWLAAVSELLPHLRFAGQSQQSSDPRTAQSWKCGFVEPRSVIGKAFDSAEEKNSKYQDGAAAADIDLSPSTPTEPPELDLNDYQAAPRTQADGQRPLASWSVSPLTIPEARLNGVGTRNLDGTQPRVGGGGGLVRPSSTGQASVSTTNNEYGLTYQLSRQAVSSPGGSAGEFELAESIGSDSQHQQTHAGPFLDINRSASPVSAPEVDEADNDDVAAPPEQERGHTLGRALRKAFVTSKDGDRKASPKFLPADALDRILTKSAVREELRQCNFEPEVVENYASRIWNASRYQTGGHDKLKSRRKIFAILVMLGQVPKIEYFIKNHISDADLPFTHVFDEECLYAKQHDGDLKKAITCFSDNGSSALHYADSFARDQWYLLAPDFKLADGPDSANKVIHYNLENETVLPFIEEDNSVEASGFARVWRVKIHPAHYNCRDPDDPLLNPSFAVKQLHSMKKENFDAEVESLKRHLHTNNNHLIKLLLTYNWRGNWYLVFPWAEENLRTFWKTYLPWPERSHARALWIARQCAGLAQGIDAIHCPQMREEVRLELSISQRDKNLGRHGDLKPENILWFKQSPDGYRGPSPMGTLKITDFGLTRYHGSNTVEEPVPDGFPVSPTYRTPEYEIRKTLSPEYDIWTFGCVLLEFVIWYFRGWDGVDKFSKDRAIEDFNEIKEDTYFQLVKIDQPPPNDIGGRLKPSVERWIQEIQDDPDCSEYFNELLDFILKSLLRIRPGKRPKSHELKKKFDGMLGKCELNASYCAGPNSRRSSRRPSRSFSPLPAAAPVDLSKHKKKEVRESNIPQHTGEVEGLKDRLPELPSAHDLVKQRSTQFPATAERKGSTAGADSVEAGPGHPLPTQSDTDHRLSIISSHGLANANPHIKERPFENGPVLPEGQPQQSPTASSRANSFSMSSPTLQPQRPISPSISEVVEDARSTDKQLSEEVERRGSTASMPGFPSRRQGLVLSRTIGKPPEPMISLRQEPSALSQPPTLSTESSRGPTEDTPMTTQRFSEDLGHGDAQSDSLTVEESISHDVKQTSNEPPQLGPLVEAQLRLDLRRIYPELDLCQHPFTTHFQSTSSGNSETMAQLSNQSSNLSSNYGEPVVHQVNVLSSCYLVDSAAGLKGLHYCTTGGPSGIPEVPSSGLPSPPTSPPLAALTSSNELALLPKNKKREIPGRRLGRRGGAARSIREDCERFFCESMKAVFLGERNPPKHGSGLSAAYMQTPPPDDQFLAQPRRGSEVKPHGFDIDAWLEVWDYAGGASFRAFVANDGEEKSLFVFFDIEGVLGRDLKRALMALIELADGPLDCSRIVTCIDRRIPSEEAVELTKSLQWVGFELTTLDHWAKDLDVTSNQWVFMGMEI